MVELNDFGRLVNHNCDDNKVEQVCNKGDRVEDENKQNSIVFVRALYKPKEINAFNSP
jgi:hypothetical protein